MPFTTWFTGEMLDTYTTEQLGMCEKEDLVNYILSLKDSWLEKQDCLTDLEEEVERLQAWEENNLIHKDSVKPVKRVTRSDTRIKQLEEQLEKLKLESHLYDECVVKGMQNHIKRLKEEAIKYRTYHEDKCNECEEQRERADFNEKEINKLKEQQAPAPELWIRGTIESNSKLYKENKELKEEIEQLKEENDDLMVCDWGLDDEEVENWIKDSGKVLVDEDEYEKLKEENEKLKIDDSMNTQYWRCYLSYADPKGYATPEKEHIDNWCKNGDTVDEKLKEYLYDGFCIDEDEDE